MKIYKAAVQYERDETHWKVKCPSCKAKFEFSHCGYIAKVLPAELMNRAPFWIGSNCELCGHALQPQDAYKMCKEDRVWVNAHASPLPSSQEDGE